jgi:beta-lactamase superfamily II metal-dependent hydrolase
MACDSWDGNASLTRDHSLMKRIVAAFLFAALLSALPALSQPAPSMTAHFIDVGQAHATLLEFSCGAMLIDVGAQDDDHEQALIDYLEQFFARRTPPPDADPQRTSATPG